MYRIYRHGIQVNTTRNVGVRRWKDFKKVAYGGFQVSGLMANEKVILLPNDEDKPWTISQVCPRVEHFAQMCRRQIIFSK